MALPLGIIDALSATSPTSYSLGVIKDAPPCWEALYKAAPTEGDNIAINVESYNIRDESSGDRELRESVRALSNGRATGTLHMKAEHIKAWLWVIECEEDP